MWGPRRPIFLILLGMGGLWHISRQPASAQPLDSIAHVLDGQGRLRVLQIWRGGRPQGTWVHFYPSGDTMAIDTYHQGVLMGPQRSYGFGGKLQSVETWTEGMPDGPARTYHPDGSLHRQGRYTAGLYEGLWETYHPSHGRLEQVGTYRRGLPDGRWVTLAPGGDTLEVSTYRAGVIEGPFIVYRRGRPYQETIFREGRAVGRPRKLPRRRP